MKKILSLCWGVLIFSKLCADPTTWTPAISISTPGAVSYDQQIVIDPLGNATAIWAELGGEVKTRSLLLGGMWGSTTTLSSSANSASTQLVVDASGTVTAIWIEGSDQTVRANRMVAGIWGGSSTTLSSPGASFPSMAIDTLGNVVAVWARNNAGTIDIESATNLLGVWGAVDVLGQAVSDPSMAFPKVSLANDVVIAVWHGENLSSVNVIYSADKTILGGLWSAANIISDPLRESTTPNVAVDPTGIAYAIWFQYTLNGTLYSDVTMQIATKPNAGAWGLPSVVASVGMADPNHMMNQILIDNLGTVMVLWDQTTDGSNYQTISRTKPLTEGWSKENALSNVSPASFYCNAAITAGSDIYASSMDYDYDTGSLIINVSQTQLDTPLPGRWQDTTVVSTGTENGFPHVAVSLSGTTLNSNLVWLNNNGSNNELLSITGSASIPLPPTNFTVTPGTIIFGSGTFIEYINTLAWLPSLDPDLMGYYILRNNMMISDVDAGLTQYIDHNRPPNEHGTYGISAHMTDGSQSSLITIAY